MFAGFNGSTDQAHHAEGQGPVPHIPRGVSAINMLPNVAEAVQQHRDDGQKSVEAGPLESPSFIAFSPSTVANGLSRRLQDRLSAFA